MHTSWIPQLTSDRSRLAPRHGKHAKARQGRGQLQKGRYKPRLEQLEARTVPSNWAVAGPNVNIDPLAGNQAESTISINPTNPLNRFAQDTLSNVGRFSTEGGQTWKTSDLSALPSLNGDVQTAWDQFGNLFMIVLTPPCKAGVGCNVEFARSSDGGATF